MTNNTIFNLMAENATSTDSNKTLNNALKLMNYVHHHPHDFAADYARDFITAYLSKDYIDMMTIISNFAKYLAREREIVEELN